MRRTLAISLSLSFMLLTTAIVDGATLTVGPEQDFERIAVAYKKAQPGDTILVHPRANNASYKQVALFIKKPHITLRAVKKDGERVRLDGEGFVYTGIGSTPRAIIQFNPGANGGVVQGFELTGAHNQSYNGAGVRINQANNVTILDCDIHGNDMGIMSGGSIKTGTGANQRIMGCLIHHNGNKQDPGYNHNLYLGGSSALVFACEIHHSITGHNLKSRAHYNKIGYCYIHDSANRELDLVDKKGNTEAPDSDTLLWGSIIVKSRPTKGNHGVIQFGADGGHNHNGTLFLIHNTIVTPYSTPVVQLTSPDAKLQMHNNIVWAAGTNEANRHLVHYGGKSDPAGSVISHNWFADGYAPPKGTEANWSENYFAKQPNIALFVDPQAGNFHLRSKKSAAVNLGLPLQKLSLPDPEGKDKIDSLWAYKPPLDTVVRYVVGLPDAGAYEAPR